MTTAPDQSPHVFQADPTTGACHCGQSQEAPNHVPAEQMATLGVPDLPAPNPEHLPSLLWWARVNAIGTPDAAEVAPGVMLAEANAAAWHAVHIQGGFSDPVCEADRLSKDRHGIAPAEAPEPYHTAFTPASPVVADGTNTAALQNAVRATTPEQAKVYLLQYEADSDLARLHEAYEDAKAAAKEADDRYKSATAALKAAATAEAPDGTTSISLQGPGGPVRSVSYVESFRFDSKALKAADVVTYARYAVKTGSWVLR